MVLLHDIYCFSNSGWLGKALGYFPGLLDEIYPSSRETEVAIYNVIPINDRFLFFDV